ncbi:MAG: hypothetical protein R3C55_08485 [Parvularculaceae bacterium]
MSNASPRRSAQLIFEPGRMIVGNAGVLVSRVIYDKEGSARRFLIIDAAMNDLIRPALYDAHHTVIPVDESEADAVSVAYDVVGPVRHPLSTVSGATARCRRAGAGKLCRALTAGADGAQASQYNTRPLIPEVLVNGARYAVIRRRPTFEEMTALEEKPDWL